MVTSNLAYKINIPQIENTITNKTSLNWCSISLTDVISRGKRLDASVFDVESKHAWEKLLKGKYKCVPLLGENGLIHNAYYPGRFKRIYCDKLNGEEFYLPSQMTDIYPKPEKWISKCTNCDINELRLKENTLLLTRSGTIGTISLVSKTIQDKIFSDDVIRITFKKIFDLGYVYTFLKSKIGNKVLTTNGYGSVITHLEPEHLKEILIPDASNKIKEKIHRLIIKSYALRDESNTLIDEATKLLVDELHLPPIHEFNLNDYKKDAAVETFNVKLSDLNGRVDASYHVPLVNAILKHLKKYAAEITTIGDKRISSDIILPGRFKRIYVEEGYGRIFIGGKQLGELNPENKKYLSLAHHGDRIANQLELHKNMTLITCSGTIGKVALVGSQWENWTANQHIIRVVPVNDNIAGYLNIFLSSDYGYELIRRYTYGSVVDEIDDNHVKKVAIPLLKNVDVQTKINELALEANQKRYEAYQLEQKALKIMDDEVIYAK